MSDKCPNCNKGYNSPCEVCGYNWSYAEAKRDKKLNKIIDMLSDIKSLLEQKK